MLMRQIKNLKDLDSNLGNDLESSSRTFMSGVQIVRTGRKPDVRNNKSYKKVFLLKFI